MKLQLDGRLLKPRRVSAADRIRGVIAFEKRRLADPYLREDVREIARCELNHWRKKLINLRVKQEKIAA